MAISLRALAFGPIRELVKLYSGPTRIVNELLGMGIHYTTQTMYRDVNSALDWKRNAERIWSADPMTPLPHTDFVRKWNMRQDYRYRFVGLVTIQEPGELEPTTRMMSFYTNVNMPSNLQGQQMADWINRRGLAETSGDPSWIIDFKQVASYWNPERGHLDAEDVMEEEEWLEEWLRG